VYTESAVHVQAQGRLVALLNKLAQVGVSATGGVGDTNPMYAIEDALRTGHFDALLISTLPLNKSKWLRQDLPSRAARRFNLPVEHVISDPPNDTPAEPSKKERGRHERQTA
jgi:GABA permease